MSFDLTVQRPADMTVEEEHDLQAKLDAAIERYKKSAVDLTKLSMECTTLATATESRARQLTEQGFLRRFWNGITGTNRRMRDLNTRDLARGQYVAQRMLGRLAEQNALTMQTTMAVGNMVCLATKRVDDLQANQVNMWKTIGVLAADVQQKLQDHSERLLQLEHSDRLNRWNDTLLVSEERGVPYADLPLEARLVVVLNEFHETTAGNWDPVEDWKILRAAFLKLGIHYRNDTIVPMVFAEKLWTEEALSNRLFRGCAGDLDDLESPIYSPPLYGVRKMLSFKNGDRYILETARAVTGRGEEADGELALTLSNHFVHQLTAVDLSAALTIDEFARSMLIGMKFVQATAERTQAEAADMRAAEVEVTAQDAPVAPEPVASLTPLYEVGSAEHEMWESAFKILDWLLPQAPKPAAGEEFPLNFDNYPGTDNPQLIGATAVLAVALGESFHWEDSDGNSTKSLEAEIARLCAILKTKPGELKSFSETFLLPFMGRLGLGVEENNTIHEALPWIESNTSSALNFLDSGLATLILLAFHPRDTRGKWVRVYPDVKRSAVLFSDISGLRQKLLRLAANPLESSQNFLGVQGDLHALLPKETCRLRAAQLGDEGFLGLLFDYFRSRNPGWGPEEIFAEVYSYASNEPMDDLTRWHFERVLRSRFGQVG
ncbi:MAG: hypothetical protein ACLFTT_11170 [Candidatus Hydrogenedentota bacterium]